MVLWKRTHTHDNGLEEVFGGKRMENGGRRGETKAGGGWKLEEQQEETTIVTIMV